MANTKQPPIDEWQARDAADTLARAEAIKALHTAAKGSAQSTINKLQAVVNTPSAPTKPAKAAPVKPAAKAPKAPITKMPAKSRGK